MRRNRPCSADAAVCIISRLLGGLQRQQAPQCGAPSTRAPPRHLPTARSLPGVQEFEIIQSVRLSVHLPASPRPGLAWPGASRDGRISPRLRVEWTLFRCSAIDSYDTMRDASLTCAQKLTRVSSIYRTEP